MFHLLVPLIPRIGDDGLERGELLVGHVERAQEVLLEQGRTGEREQQRRREGLAAVDLALGERRFVGIGRRMKLLQ